MASQRRQVAQKGVSLLVGTASLILLIPSAGLAIDAALLYYTKARIQGAVDGAALAAARSLSLGATTASQSATAKQNAVNWFYANFPTTLWGTSNTQMDQSSVQVFDDMNNPNLRNVTVQAKTTVPTIFMRWFNTPSTDVGSIGNASRRDAVVMMVLDRSGSMAGVPCTDLKAAAKVFTGQFAAQRDRIGMVTFSDGTYVASAPSTDFRTVLGYDDGTTVGNGAIDNIGCTGGTNTPAALSMGYNEVYKMNLPGAFNVLFLETDGLPNSLTLNWWDSASGTVGLVNTSGCTDKLGKTVNTGGWTAPTNQRDWNNTNGHAMGPNGFMGDIPAGAVGTLDSSDPVVASPGTGTFSALYKPWHTSSNQGSSTQPSLNGCAFSSGTHITDLKWIPSTDVYGNAINPATNPYKGVAVNGQGRIDLTSGTTNQKWVKYHNAALNAADNAAYRARTNGTIPATMFVIGLGGNTGGGPPIDHTLLQRIANDPAADGFNSPAAYNACATTPSCVNYTDQPQGTYIYSVDHTELKSAFLKLSSQILRLSK